MRARFLCTLVLFLLAAPLHAQVCSPGAAPDISTLFPESVEGLERQFYRTSGEHTTHLYQGGAPWAAVSIEPNGDASLGETAQGLVEHYERKGADLLLHEGWPVTRVDTGELGSEYVTLRGAVRITVLVKEGDRGEASDALARAFFDAIFDRVPCEPGT